MRSLVPVYVTWPADRDLRAEVDMVEQYWGAGDCFWTAVGFGRCRLESEHGLSERA